MRPAVNYWLLFRRRIFIRWRRAAVLKESDTAEARLAIALVLATVIFAIGLIGATALVLTTATLAFAVGLSIAVGLLRFAALALLRGIGLSLFAAIAPTLVVALDETALGLDHAEIVVGILPVRLSHDSIAR